MRRIRFNGKEITNSGNKSLLVRLPLDNRFWPEGLVKVSNKEEAPIIVLDVNRARFTKSEFEALSNCLANNYENFVTKTNQAIGYTIYSDLPDYNYSEVEFICQDGENFEVNSIGEFAYLEPGEIGSKRKRLLGTVYFGDSEWYFKIRNFDGDSNYTIATLSQCFHKNQKFTDLYKFVPVRPEN